jgi:hypothetical protein
MRRINTEQISFGEGKRPVEGMIGQIDMGHNMPADRRRAGLWPAISFWNETCMYIAKEDFRFYDNRFLFHEQ